MHWNFKPNELIINAEANHDLKGKLKENEETRPK